MPKHEFIINIDDNPIANTICKLLVEMNDLATRFESFTNPEEALSFLKGLVEKGDNFPCLIFLDINMPEMDGWEFLEIYKDFPAANRSTCRIFMVSSSIYEKDKERADQHEMLSGFVSKPLTLEVFEEIDHPK